MPDRDEEARIDDRIASLERRIAALERGAAGAWPAPPPPAPRVAVEPPAPMPEPIRPAPPAIVPVASAAPPTRPPVTPETPPLAPASGDGAFERFVGGKLAAWLGALVVIAGLAIFAKFAFDQGWFARLGPRGRFTLGAAASLALVLAGELLRGRIGAVPATGLVAGGIGGLYASIFAGTSLLGVLGLGGTLVASVVTVALGTALAWRSGSLAVAMLSLLGGYGAIGLMMRPLEGALPVAAYLTLLWLAALGLAAAGPPRFAWLRILGLLHGFAGLVWAVGPARNERELAFVFVALWWTAAVAESTFAAMRGRTDRANTVATLAATSLAATLALRGAWSPTPWSDLLSWLPALLAALAAAGAWQCGGFGPAPDDDEADPEASRREATLARQGRTLAFAAAALVAVQVGVLLREGSLVVAWSAVGLVGVLAGVRIGPRSLATAGFLTLGLALLVAIATLVFGSFGGVVFAWPTAESAWAIRLREAWWAPVVAAFALLFAARAWAGAVAAERPDRVSAVASIASMAAALLWTAISFANLDRYAAIAGLLAVPVAATLAGRTPVLVKTIGLAWCLLAAAGWFLVTADAAGLDPGLPGRVVLARPEGGLVLAGLVSAAFAFVGLRFRGEPFAETAAAGGIAFGLAALGFATWIDLGSGVDPDAPVASAGAAAAVGFVAAIAASLASRTGLELAARTALVAVAIAAVGWLTAGTVLGDFAAGKLSARPWLANGQNLAGVALAFALVVARGSLRGPDAPRWADLFGGLLLALGAVGSSLALWRLLAPGTGPLGAEGALQEYAQSVWWAILAIGLVALGFRRERRGLRWIGLVALGLVAAKVLVLDMRNAATIWRVAALLAIGLLLVGTSVLYARLAPDGVRRT